MNNLFEEFKIEIDTEKDFYALEISDLVVDIENREATVIQAVNSLAEQIARLEMLTDIYRNKAMNSDDKDKYNEDDFNNLCREYTQKCIDTFKAFM